MEADFCSNPFTMISFTLFCAFLCALIFIALIDWNFFVFIDGHKDEFVFGLPPYRPYLLDFWRINRFEFEANKFYFYFKAHKIKVENVWLLASQPLRITYARMSDFKALNLRYGSEWL